MTMIGGVAGIVALGWVVSWGDDTDPSRLRAVLGALKGIRVDGICSVEDPEDRKRILIGSYVTSGPGVHSVTPLLRRSLMDRSLSKARLRDIVEKGHRLRSVK